MFVLDCLGIFYFYKIIDLLELYLYFPINKRNNNNNLEMVRTNISSFHAIVLTISNLLYLLNIIDKNINDIFLLFSFSYALNDLMYLTYSKIKIKNQMIFHHILLIIALIIKYLYNDNNDIYRFVSINFLTEISTFPLNEIWILNIEKKTDTNYFKIMCFLTLVFYFIFRILIGIYLCIEIFNNYKYLCLLQFPLTFLNFYWFEKLLEKFLKFNKK